MRSESQIHYLLGFGAGTLGGVPAGKPTKENWLKKVTVILRETVMKILNVHERSMDGPRTIVSELLDGLSGPNDRLWPGDRWPAMKLDSPLNVGSVGGHGQVHYRVSEYSPGTKVAFRFNDSGLVAGLEGGHWFEVISNGEQTVLRHVIEATCNFRDWLFWAVVVRPLHDALLEDALDQAERAMTPSSNASSRWSLWVRFLRFLLKRGSPS
jgi:hypothetical protein